MKALKQNICRAAACAALALAAFPASAGGYGGGAGGDGGAVIYDNGAPNHQSGNNMGFAWQAEDFTLGSATDLNSVTFWSLEAANAYRGSISWEIVADSGGAPSSMTLAAGSANAPTRSLVGNYLGLDEYANNIVLGSLPLSLAAGTYWLVLHNGDLGDLGDPNEFLWETTGPNASLPGMESFDGGASWSGNFSEHAFQISAVPEPGAPVMLAGGLLLVGLLRRKQGADGVR